MTAAQTLGVDAGPEFTQRSIRIEDRVQHTTQKSCEPYGRGKVTAISHAWRGAVKEEAGFKEENFILHENHDRL